MSSNLERTTGSAAVNSSPAVGDDLQENLRHLDRLANLGLISASVAHEIKNGLVAINTFVEVLMEKNGDSHQEMTDMVHRELRRIDQLVTQMLRHASPRPPQRTKVKVHQLLDHSLRLLEHQMNGKMIQLKRDYQASPDEVHGDESQLQQAFMNLLLNGVEAIGKNGELAVLTVIQPGGDGKRQLVIQIRDTGPGITPDNLSRLFHPFFTTKKMAPASDWPSANGSRRNIEETSKCKARRADPLSLFPCRLNKSEITETKNQFTTPYCC